MGQMAEAWRVGPGDTSNLKPSAQKERKAAGPDLQKECLTRVGTVGGACMEAIGRCWTVPGSFPLRCSLPEIYFLKSFILIKISLDLRGLCV